MGPSSHICCVVVAEIVELVVVIFKKALKKVCYKTVCLVSLAAASYISSLLYLLIVSFPLVLNLISCCLYSNMLYTLVA